MPAASVLIDGFTRVRDSQHHILEDLTDDELTREPHPPIGWLSWRVSRILDSNVTRLQGREQLWIADGWHQRFGMPPEPADFGRGAGHTREQVRAFRAGRELLLAYHDVAYDLTMAYVEKLTQEDLDRELNEPQYQPLPTLGVRLMSLLENGMQNSGQMGYLKALHRLGGWFPAEGGKPLSYR
jgi:hypothetical protein